MDISITHQNGNIQPRYTLVEIDPREWRNDPRSQFDDVPPHQCRARMSFYRAGTAPFSPLLVHHSDDRLPPRNSSPEPAILRFFLETSRLRLPSRVGADASASLRQQCRSVCAVRDRSFPQIRATPARSIRILSELIGQLILAYSLEPRKYEVRFLTCLSFVSKFRR